MDTAVLAGSFSTALFVFSYLPMLVKAARTRDLDSYSRGQLGLATVGNAVNSLYVCTPSTSPRCQSDRSGSCTCSTWAARCSCWSGTCATPGVDPVRSSAIG